MDPQNGNKMVFHKKTTTNTKFVALQKNEKLIFKTKLKKKKYFSKRVIAFCLNLKKIL